jgi:phosphate-selective porin OprO/OprP
MVAALLLALLAASPSFQLGKFLRVDLRARAHAEAHPGDHFDFERARIGVDGRFLKHFQYEVERDFASKHHWKDIRVDFDRFGKAAFQAGKFKIPFSLDQLTSINEHDFVNRSQVAQDLAPARDIGVMLHGRLLRKFLRYQAGVFRNDGENSESKTAVRGTRTYAARLTLKPLRKLDVGGGVASSDVPEGLNGLRGENTPAVFVSGRRLRVGTEFQWEPGPFSLRSEWIRVSEAREGQSVRGTDLPAKISRGWYVSGTWKINKPLQLALRYEQIRFGSADSTGTAFNSPRAPNLMMSSERIWTGGVNWFVNRFAKVQINGIHDGGWGAAARLQFSM